MGEIGNGIEGQMELTNDGQDIAISPKAESMLSVLFNDDYDESETAETSESAEFEAIDAKQEMNNLFSDDYSDSESETKKSESDTDEQEKVDLSKQYEPNSKFEVNGQTYETDDNGYIYKEDGYKLRPDCEYTIDGVTYKTDSLGRIVSCDGSARATPDGERDNKAQQEAGGSDRKEGDQGGHIIARVLGGSKGIENMLAMRGPINQGPYSHIMEKEIKDALNDGKEVHVHVDVEYDGDSQRPSKIRVTYNIDGKDTVMEYDNDEGSTDLLDSVEDKVDEEQYNDLKNEIDEANADGAKMSIIAVKTEYDENGNITKVTIIMRDDNAEHPQNEPRVLSPKEVS